MAKLKKSIALICIAACASLLLFNPSREKIFAQCNSEEEAGFKEVFPSAAGFEAVKSGNEAIYFKALDKNKKLIGAVFKASGKGYSGTIETLAGLTLDGKITAIKVLKQNETPGAGSRVGELSFSERFSGESVQNLNQVQAITGASISSGAVIESVKNKAEEIMRLLERDK